MRSMGAALSRQQSECERGETDPHMALHAVTYGGVKHQSCRKDDGLCVRVDKRLSFFSPNNQIVTAAVKQKLESF